MWELFYSSWWKQTLLCGTTNNWLGSSKWMTQNWCKQQYHFDLYWITLKNQAVSFLLPYHIFYSIKISIKIIEMRIYESYFFFTKYVLLMFYLFSNLYAQNLNKQSHLAWLGSYRRFKQEPCYLPAAGPMKTDNMLAFLFSMAMAYPQVTYVSKILAVTRLSHMV